jgi:hypothetical protein
MKRFLKNIFLFVLTFFFLMAILEAKTRIYKTVMVQKKIYLDKNSDSIEVLILGNSHAGDGVDPTQFNLNTFNAAQGSQSLYYDMEIAKKYLDKMTSLKFVLISIDYHSLYFTYSKEREFLYSYYYGINYKKNNLIKSNISLLLWGFGLKEGFLMMLKKTPKTVKGWLGYKKTDFSTLNEFSGKKRVERFDKMIESNSVYKGEIIESLNEFISLLKCKEIEPVLLTLPCHDFYNQNLNEDTVIQNNIDIENISKLNNIKYLNLLYKKLPDTCFYNLDHLNRKGALIVSKEINNYIEAIRNEYIYDK